MLCQNGDDDDHKVHVHTHDNDVSHHGERKSVLANLSIYSRFYYLYFEGYFGLEDFGFWLGSRHLFMMITWHQIRHCVWHTGAELFTCHWSIYNIINNTLFRENIINVVQRWKRIERMWTLIRNIQWWQYWAVNTALSHCILISLTAPSEIIVHSLNHSTQDQQWSVVMSWKIFAHYF